MSMGDKSDGELGLFSILTDAERDFDMGVDDAGVKGPLQSKPVGVPKRGGRVAGAQQLEINEVERPQLDPGASDNV